jgi:hypothetical protein
VALLWNKHGSHIARFNLQFFSNEQCNKIHVENAESGPDLQAINAGKREVGETMDAKINNVIYIELYSGPKMMDDEYLKSNIARSIDRDSTVQCTVHYIVHLQCTVSLSHTYESNRFWHSSVGMGTKEDESITGCVSTGGFHHATARSRLAHVSKLMNCLSLSFLSGHSKPQVMNQWIRGHNCICFLHILHAFDTTLQVQHCYKHYYSNICNLLTHSLPAI